MTKLLAKFRALSTRKKALVVALIAIFVTVPIAYSAVQILHEPHVFDVTDTEALLVRKDEDGGDVFNVDTTNSAVEVDGTLDVGGSLMLSGGSQTIYAGGINDSVHIRGNGTGDVVIGQYGGDDFLVYADTVVTGDADVTGDLTVDGTIYGELAEDLVISAPAGFNVEIGSDGAVEMDVIKAITNDTVEIDDNVEFQGSRTVGSTGSLSFSVAGVTDDPTVVLPQDGGVALLKGTVQCGNAEDSNCSIWAPLYMNLAGHNGIEVFGEAGDNRSAIGSYGDLEFEWFTRYFDAGQGSWELQKMLMKLNSDDGLWLNDLDIRNVADLDADTATVALVQAGAVTAPNVYSDYLDVNEDFYLGDNVVMDDTGITDSSGVFQIKTTNNNLVLNAPSGDMVDIREGLNTVGRFGGSGTYELEVYNDLYTHGIIYENSDISAKQNIVPVEPVLSRFRGLRVHRYQMDHDPSVERIGLLAQELQKIFPTLVNCEDGSCAINQTDLIDVVIQAVLELDAQVQAMSDAKVDALEARVSALESQLATLQADYESLEARVAALEALLVTAEPKKGGE